jgi:hypothetical protein
MSHRKTTGLLALVLVTAFVTALAASAHAVSFSSPGAGSSNEAPAYYPPSNSPSYPANTPGASNFNWNNPDRDRGGYGSQPGYASPPDMSNQSGSNCR